jgi:hypothetical protein
MAGIFTVLYLAVFLIYTVLSIKYRSILLKIQVFLSLALIYELVWYLVCVVCRVIGVGSLVFLQVDEQ